MKIHGVKREWKYPIFVHLKKHDCPHCGARLKKTKTETIVNSNSPEAANYDFSCGDGYFVGNVKFIQAAFRCPRCGRGYSVEQIRAKELLQK